MNKFTIFTIILAVSVVTVTVDLAARDYLAKTGQTSVLSSQAPEQTPTPPEPKIAKVTDYNPVADQAVQDSSDTVITTDNNPIVPVATEPAYTPPVAIAGTSKITPEIISGATGPNFTVKEDHFNGKVFQLLDITKIPVESITLYNLSDGGSQVASITEITLQDEIRALQMYVLLQNKTKTYIDLSLNETNAYGDRSFYINHAKKPDEAFLTVKIGKRIYAFAYVKTYHPLIKKLIQSLTS